MKTYLSKVDKDKYHVFNFETGKSLGLVHLTNAGAWKAYGPDNKIAYGQSPYDAASNVGFKIDMLKTIGKMHE